jgi:SapC
MKDGETGAFCIVALFGFAPGQNRFVIDGGWRATWVPGTMLNYPFYHDETAPHSLAIDEDCALLHAAQGQALFTDGKPTSFTTRVAETIAALVDDIAAAQALARILAANAVVRPLQMILTDAARHENQIDGLYGISLQALDELDDRAVLALHRQGALLAAHVMAGSLGQLERVRQLHDHASTEPLASMAYAIVE